MADEAPVPTGPDGAGQIVIYRDGATRLQVRMEGRSVWLSQRLIAELYQVSVKTVNEHLINIYAEGELEREPTIRSFRIVQREGSRDVSRSVEHYSLDAILAVGYRVRSHRGTAFRQWATARLGELLVKGFTLDDERLKEGRTLGADYYFDELLERIRDIRASERIFYQKITDIYATSVDYDPTHPISQTFFATVQNKLHWAIHGRTAAEVIVERADAAHPHMGLTTWQPVAKVIPRGTAPLTPCASFPDLDESTDSPAIRGLAHNAIDTIPHESTSTTSCWRNAPDGPIRKADVTVAKNDLTEPEIRELNRVVTMYLDFAEDQALRRKPMHMADWVERLDAFLEFNGRNVLTHAGKVSHALAEQRAHDEFEKYDAERRRLEATQPTSDFDRAVEEVKRLEAGTRKRERPVTSSAKKKASRRRKPKGDEA